MALTPRIGFGNRMFPFFLVFSLLALGIGIAGLLYYRHQKDTIRQHTTAELSAITHLKTQEISRWREERLGNAAVISDNSMVADEIQAFFAHPSESTERQQILAWMQSLKTHYGFSDIVLLDKDFNVRLSTSRQERIGSYLRDQLPAIMKSSRSFLTDLYRSDVTGDILMSAVAPLWNRMEPGAEPVGAMVLRIDPYKFLYPFLQSWPTPSRSAETLIVRREDGEVVYLNELRHQKGTALALRFPVEKEDLPAAVAARGEERIIEGIDYRSVPVLASTRAIPGSSWVLVAKVDQEEVFQPIRDRARLTALLVGILILSAGAVSALIWHRREGEVLRKSRDELERRVEERTAELKRMNEELEAEVAERKRMERERQAYATRLARAGRELQEFTFAAAHDLQEPLRKIQTFSDLLMASGGDFTTEKHLDHLQRLHRSARQMQQLIGALLDYTKVTVVPEPFRTIGLRDLILDVVNDLEEPIRQTGARVEVGEMHFIEADKNQLRQVFAHLISNALKYRGEKASEIGIRSELTGDSCTIYIEDNGIGFEEKYVDRIFRPFQRLHSRDRYEGIGMGLAICRKIVEHHNGTIIARSEPGRGTAFVIELPVRRSRETDEEGEERNGHEEGR